MILLYLLLSLPGLIAAVLVRLWALHRKWDRSTRAWLVALTIGLLCSPGATVGGAGIPVIVPALLTLILPDEPNPNWRVILISSAITTFIAYALYEAASRHMDRTKDQRNTDQFNSPTDK